MAGLGIITTAQDLSFSRYHTPDETGNLLKSLNLAYPSATALHTIATSPGGKPVYVLETGANLKDKPAIFVGANFEGITPIATEGALYLAKLVLESEYGKKFKWFIMPLPNPDAALSFFKPVKSEDAVNSMALNNDVDNLTDEDGFDDLNKDGIITRMRVKDPEGTYIISKIDPRIMQRADAQKGERGEYKMYQEGIDNDGDGQYNEDGAGGVNVGINFPHLFDYSRKDAGLYPGYSPEAYGIMKFIFSHPEIMMVQTLGSSDFCLNPPKSGRKSTANLEAIEIPRRYATQFGVDPNRTYTMDEVIAMVKPMVPDGMEVTPALVSSVLGLGAAVNPQEEDLRFYTKLSEEYKAFLKEKNFSTDRLDPEADKNGSFELWAYYQVGCPSFAMNLFTIPKVKEEKKGGDGLTLEEVEKMSGDDFSALGEEKIDAFLKEYKAPSRYSAKSVIELIKSGRVTPKQMAAMLKSAPKQGDESGLSDKDKALLAYVAQLPEGKGFAEWKPFEHPTFGQVEIGGFTPFLESTPAENMIDSLCKSQIPWLLKLSDKLPQIKFLSEKVTGLGGGLYRVELYIENKGYLPYPTSMGQRNSQPAPVIVSLDADGLEIIDGLKRTPLGVIGGNQVKKLAWIVKSQKPVQVTARIESKSIEDDVKQIKIGG
jgi:hypothetical protein